MKEKTDILQDTYEPGEYDPALYNYARIAESVDGFENVSDEHIAQFHAQGFLPIQGAYSSAQVNDGMAAVKELIAGQNREFRGVQFERGRAKQVKQSAGSRPRITRAKTHPICRIRPASGRICRRPSTDSDTLTRIMGEPPKLFANQAMLKPPGIGREKPWHQDHAYFNVPMHTCIVSAWVALDPADPENGCMHVIPQSHRAGPVIHFKRRDWQICDTDVARNRITAVALKPGGVLLWHGRLHHGSPENRSNRRRRALQLHYIPGSIEEISSEERLAVYGSEGKDVTC